MLARRTGSSFRKKIKDFLSHALSPKGEKIEIISKGSGKLSKEFM
jgi:hypothetical protein